MAGWAGFTDEDLKQIKNTTSPGLSSRQSSAASKQAMARKQKLQQQRELAHERAQDFAQGQSSSSPLPASQRLHQPCLETPLPVPQTEQNIKSGTASEAKVLSPQQLVSGSHENDSKVDTSVDVGKTETDTDVKELDEQEVLSKELSKMEQFRRQQQQMEEENKQRRRVLADAIKQRSKLAKEEADKLTKVQKELSHLDSLVNADVCIIRDKIEAASIDFMQAQKRYERAEKEFVEAKMALAEKSDLKESLTEHLYTVIQQNETRKAERLAVLMKQLGLEAEGCSPALAVPPLLSFSSINTLHRPHFPATLQSPEAQAPDSPSVTDSINSPPDTPENVSQNEGSKEISQADVGVEKRSDSTADMGGEGGKGTEAETVQESSSDKSGDTAVKAEATLKGKSPVENGNAESQDGGADSPAEHT